MSNWNPSCFPTQFYISGVWRHCGLYEKKGFLKVNNSANAATHLVSVLCSLAIKCIQMQSDFKKLWSVCFLATLQGFELKASMLTF